MYSSHDNINILTALLQAHGIDTCVCCPGSRNAAILHNLASAGLRCIPHTDERSAAFYALGLSQGLGLRPVAVCVTSGSALLNTLPAVAEACYQRVPLVVIAADRPPQWIDQQDGQTLPQPSALGRFVRKAVSLPEPHDEEEHWHCNRLVNEALMACTEPVCGPVLINVPLREPLFDFSVAELPHERKIEAFRQTDNKATAKLLLDRLSQSRRPLVIVGQLPLKEKIPEIGGLTILHEPLSSGPADACCFENVISEPDSESKYRPDFILHLGGTLVSKQLKQWLRRFGDVDCWRLDQIAEPVDTFMNLRRVLVADPVETLRLMAVKYQAEAEARNYASLWHEALSEAWRRSESEKPDFTGRGAVKLFADELKLVPYTYYICSANSSVLRHACRYLPQGFLCNRGVNGIEGSLSAAAGLSLAVSEKVFCLIGDLSFFYDSNALWNTGLRGNLRVLLLNDGGGSIFRKFSGLKGSPAMPELIAASHETTARGICEDLHVNYLSATGMNSLHEGICRLLTMEARRPVVLEIKL